MREVRDHAAGEARPEHHSGHAHDRETGTAPFQLLGKVKDDPKFTRVAVAPLVDFERPRLISGLRQGLHHHPKRRNERRPFSRLDTRQAGSVRIVSSRGRV